MAHYAYVDENNVVTSIIVGPDQGTEPEGISSWEDYFTAKGKGVCLRTSYNTYGNQNTEGGIPFRGNYAQLGGTYDAQRDVFIHVKPYNSWILDESTFLWKPPVPIPQDHETTQYVWNEDSVSWVTIQRLTFYLICYKLIKWQK